MSSEPIGNNADNLERLEFRRQFLLGPEPFMPNKYWTQVPMLHGLHLSIHLDLPYVTAVDGTRLLTLIGLAVDPYHLKRKEKEILLALADHASTVDTLIAATAPLGGRWVIILQDPGGTWLFTDPCGFRQVFYTSDGEYPWCASQPELIKASLGLELNPDEALQKFITSPEFLQKESPWVGTQTRYQNCFHLLPNHYLDAGTLEQKRFYPLRTLPKKGKEEILDTASFLLRGLLTAIAKNHRAVLALTAGWDSRVLLAASREVCSELEYYVDRKGTLARNHPDVVIPEKLAKRLKLHFEVKDSRIDPPAWFTGILEKNVSGARLLPKTRMIYNKYLGCEQRLNINGNGGEICRNYYDKYPASLFGENELVPSMLLELRDWKEKLEGEMGDGYHILDLLYWEQRLGGWGAQFPAEQDVIVEELSPFNCRLLIETLLSSPRAERAAPHYPLFRDLIKKMWGDTLVFPINPRVGTSFPGFLKSLTRLSG